MFSEPGEAAERSAGARSMRAMVRSASRVPVQEPRSLQRVPAWAAGGSGTPGAAPITVQHSAYDKGQHVQPGPKISSPGDVYEQEADRAADHATHTPKRQVQPASQQPQADSTVPAVALRPLQRLGQPLDATVQERMGPRLGNDFARVRVHADAEAADAAHALRARAYTVGDHIVFGTGQYAPATAEGERLLAHELTHVAQQAGGRAPAIQRKEVTAPTDLQGPKDWTTADREGNTQRWQEACLANLNAVDSSQYVRVVERRDFYKWFYAYTVSLGYSTRWALAAYIVANGAHEIADMDVDHDIANDTLGLANVELQGAMREGNQDIFDNVLPKLKELLDGGSLTGRAALKWDMQVLAEEQTLIQPMYNRMAPETVEQLDYIARMKRFVGWGASFAEIGHGGIFVPPGPGRKPGIVPSFAESSLLSVRDRWTYGMKLGSQFTPGGTGFDPGTDVLPPVGPGYTSGNELAKVDARAALHELDAWLNPERLSRVGPGSDIQTIINKLTPAEKLQVLSDRSADGWAYSAQFAQFSFITEATVRQALPNPSTPRLLLAVAGFLGHYTAERARVELRYPQYPHYGYPF
jgi:hypothetical protein